MNQQLAEFEGMDLRELVAHRHWLPLNASVAQAHELFTAQDIQYLAVLDGAAIAGMCSRDYLDHILSHLYGRSVFLKDALSEGHFQPATRATLGEQLTAVFQRAFFRPAAQLFEDVMLVDKAGAYFGMIPMSRLIQLQHKYFLTQIEVLDDQRAELMARHEQTQADLAMARDLQLSFLPPLCSADAHGRPLSCHYRFLAADSLSGDFIQILDSGPDTLGILLCDVMGHGVRSALITALIRGLVERLASLHDSPGALLRQINRDLIASLRGHGQVIFVTACCLIVDYGRKEVRFATAGHHAPLRVRGNSIAEMGTTNSNQAALGLLPDANYDTSRDELQSGDKLLLYTDGLFEARNLTNEEYGVERLKAAICRNQGAGTEKLIDAILKEAGEFTHPRPFDDDVCIVAIAYDGAFS